MIYEVERDYTSGIPGDYSGMKIGPPISLSMCLGIIRQWASCNNVEIHTNQAHHKANDHISYGQ